jgi:hypothetical protein
VWGKLGNACGERQVERLPNVEDLNRHLRPERGRTFGQGTPVKAADWSAILAGVALLLGLVNLWYGVIRPLWRNREASPAAQLDLLRYPAQSGGRWQQEEEEERVVVTNHGPARMRNLSVEVFDQEGRSA